MAGGGEEGAKGQDNGRDRDNRGQGDYGVYGINRSYGGGQLGDVGGPIPDGVPVGDTGGGGRVAGGGPDSKGEEVLRGHWPHRDEVEGSGGNFKSPAHGLHHLPRLSPWISAGSRHRYRHPQV